METEFKIGDTAWVKGYEGQKQVKSNCPVCFGKLKVTLVLGNEDRMEIDCDHCGIGHTSPRGYILEWEYKATAELVTITGMDIDRETIRYKSVNRIHDELFDTREEALAESQRLVDKCEKDDMTRVEFLKKSQAKSYSWNAGYHMREAKRHEKQAEYHRKKSVICKGLAKAEKGE